MIKKEWNFCYESGIIEELTTTEQELVQQARQAATEAYAPYSHFRVGCALELTDGTILTGNNQENASYPCGICAERTTLHYAQPHHRSRESKWLDIESAATLRFVSSIPARSRKQAGFPLAHHHGRKP